MRTMATEANKTFVVGIILYDGVDILDFAAPVGIFSDIKHKTGPYSGQAAFKIHHLAAESRVIHVGAGKTSVTPDMVFKEAYQMLDVFDILVIPGGQQTLVLKMATGDGPEVQFIKAFTTQARKAESPERIAFSICDGSLFLAAVGALSGLSATSHHTTLDDMKKLDASIEVVDSTANGRARRYVDSGLNPAGVRIVTAGGVTCGLDASLYVAGLKVGDGPAEDWATMNEYEWRKAK